MTKDEIITLLHSIDQSIQENDVAMECTFDSFYRMDEALKLAQKLRDTTQKDVAFWTKEANALLNQCDTKHLEIETLQEAVNTLKKATPINEGLCQSLTQMVQTHQEELQRLRTANDKAWSEVTRAEQTDKEAEKKCRYYAPAPKLKEDYEYLLRRSKDLAKEREVLIDTLAKILILS